MALPLPTQSSRDKYEKLQNILKRPNTNIQRDEYTKTLSTSLLSPQIYKMRTLHLTMRRLMARSKLGFKLIHSSCNSNVRNTLYITLEHCPGRLLVNWEYQDSLLA